MGLGHGLGKRAPFDLVQRCMTCRARSVGKVAVRCHPIIPEGSPIYLITSLSKA